MLFEEIDKEITKKSVDYLLSRYHKIRRLAGSYTPKITSSYSLTPRSDAGTTSDSTGDTVEIKGEAAKELEAIEKAFNHLSADSKKRLYFKYISEDSQYDYQIYTNQNISRNTYYRELGKAQLEFAEAYKSGNLLSFEGEK